MQRWPTKAIGDLCTLATGGTPSRAKPEYFGGDIPWLVSGDIHRGQIFECDGRITDAGMRSCNAKLLPRDSVMIALNGQGKTRATVAMLRMEAACNQSLVCLSPKDRSVLLPEFLYTNLHGRYEELRRLTSDDDKDRRGLNMGVIREIEVPVPPIAVQRRIVAILDEAFAAIATAKANTEKSLQNARGLPELGYEAIINNLDQSRWGQATVAELAAATKGAIRTGPFGSQLLHSEFVDHGIAVLGIDNAVANEFRWGKRRYITEAKYRDLCRYQVHPGDVLITIMGTCGRCAVVPEDIPTAINTKHLCCITLDRSKCLPEFLHLYFLHDPRARGYLGAQAKGSIMDGLNMGIISMLPVRTPTLEQQAHIVDRFEVLQAEHMRLTDALGQKLVVLDELKKSLLHQAFNGQLTARSTDRQLEAVA